MTSGTHQDSGIGRGFAEDLSNAARENPVSAALIGAGVLWLFFGGSKVLALGRMLPGAAKSVAGTLGSTAEAGARTIGDGVAAAGSRVNEAATQVGSAVSAAARELSDFASEAVSKGSGGAASFEEKAAKKTQATEPLEGNNTSWDAGLNFVTTMQKNLTETLEKQPLLLGAVGLAIGAGIASSFSATNIETRLMGETGTAVKEGVEKFADDAGNRAKRAFQEATEEAEAQGFTPSAAKDTLQGMADKLKTVAGTTRDSVKERLS